MCLWIFDNMYENTVTMGFLSYKPNVYEFLCNLSCQLSETMLFTDMAPVLIEEKLCFLFYKQVDVSRFEVYWAVNSILNNNISNFYDRCGVDFNQHFNKGLRLLLVRPMNDNFFTFGVNKRIASEHEGNLKMDGGKRVTYECVMQPHMVPVYRYMQTSYNRDQINLDEWSYVIPNVEQEDRTLWKGHILKSRPETRDPRPGTLRPETQDPGTLRPKTLGPGTLRLGTLRQWNWDLGLGTCDHGTWDPDTRDPGNRTLESCD